MQTDATYCKRTNEELVDGYALPEAVACALRKPVIQYPNGRVPVGVARACFPQGKDSLAVDAEGTVALDDLMQRFGASAASTEVRETFFEAPMPQLSRAPLLVTAACAR